MPRLPLARLLLSLLILQLPAFAAPPATQPATPQPAPSFLTAAETNQALLDNSDGYLTNLQTLEMSAKTGAPVTGADLPAQREEFRRRYAQGGVDFTADEKADLTAAVAAIHSLLAADFPLFGAQPFSFAKVTGNVERGLSHTRGDYIILPEPELAHLQRAMARRGDRAQNRLFALCPLLVHEQVHVLQRRHPQPFAKLYERWGFVHAAGIAACPYLEARQVANPDAVDLNWVFAYRDPAAPDTARYLWPRVILNADPKDAATAVPNMPDDFQLVAIELAPAGEPNQFKVVTDASGHPQSRPLPEVREYLAAVHGSRYSFHPHEAAADLFQRLFVRGYILPHTGNPAPLTPNEQRVQTAFREVFK